MPTAVVTQTQAPASSREKQESSALTVNEAAEGKSEGITAELAAARGFGIMGCEYCLPS